LMARLRRGPVAVVLVLVHFACAALPPGYEDELYCPSTHCLRGKAGMPPGFTGPISSFWECVSQAGKAAPSQRPSPWGSNHGEDARHMLLAEGYHMQKCSADAEPGSEKEPGLDDIEIKQPEVNPDIEVEQPEVGGGEAKQPEQQGRRATEQGSAGETSAGESGLPMPMMLAAALVAVASFSLFRKPAAKAATPEQKALLGAARKQRLDKLEKETEEIRETDEWKAREKAAKDEVKGILPENRRAGAAMGRCGHDQTSVRKSR